MGIRYAFGVLNDANGERSRRMGWQAAIFEPERAGSVCAFARKETSDVAGSHTMLPFTQQKPTQPKSHPSGRVVAGGS